MKQKQFTLVEILVAIGIIVVLSAMLLGGVTAALAKGEQAQAKTDMVTLKNAIAAFEMEYHRLPKPKNNSGNKAYDGTAMIEDKKDDGKSTYKWLLLTLQGEPIPSDMEKYGKFNPKKKKFLDVQGNKEGEWNDPWDQPYNIVFEIGHDKGIVNTADDTPVDGMKKGTIRQSVIIWSDGEDDSKKKDNIYSVNTIWNDTDKCHDITR